MSNASLINLKRHIINIMTLRYDPLEPPSIRLRNWQDFLPQEYENPNKKLEELVKKVLEEEVIDKGYRKVAIALSGGVDSTFILSMLRKISPNIKINAICATFRDIYDETEKAEKIAKKYKCNFHIVEIIDPFIKLRDLIRITGEPRWNLYFYYVLEKASKDNDIILTGDGGDELFGGYIFRYHKFLSNLKEEDCWKEKVINYIECHERDWVPDQEKLFGTRMNFKWDEIYELLRHYFDNPLNPLDQVFLADFNGKLVFDWIPTNKKLSKYLGIEYFAPFLEEEIIDFATHLPNRYKYDYNSNIGKKILRDLLECENIFLDFQKIGFGMDLPRIWEMTGKSWFNLYLSSNSIVVNNGIVNEEWLKKAYEKATFEKSPRYINKLLSILSLEIWLREFNLKV